MHPKTRFMLVALIVASLIGIAIEWLKGGALW